MARKSSSGSSGARGTRAETVMETQKRINREYVNLYEEYKKLFAQLWRIPATKYILAGVGAGICIPMGLRYFRNHPDLKFRVKENLGAVGDQLSHVGEVITDKISELRGKGTVEEEFDEARH